MLSKVFQKLLDAAQGRMQPWESRADLIFFLSIRPVVLETCFLLGELPSLAATQPRKPAPAFGACWGFPADSTWQQSDPPPPLKGWTNGSSPCTSLNTSWNYWYLAHAGSEVLWIKQELSSLLAAWTLLAASHKERASSPRDRLVIVQYHLHFRFRPDCFTQISHLIGVTMVKSDLS